MAIVDGIQDGDGSGEIQIFKDHGISKYDPNEKGSPMHLMGTRKYQKIVVHHVFACKHDGCHKACLIAGSHLTPDPVDSVYSGVVSTKSLRLPVFLAKLNDMEA